VSPAVYQSDPDPEPDANFVAGELGHLVVGNLGRLLDARRTPISITAVVAPLGAFEVEIGGFEDAGARWELALEEVARFQFARSARVAPAPAVEELERALARFDRLATIECDPAVGERTLATIAVERRAARDWLARKDAFSGVDLERHVADREGDPRLATLFEGFLAERGLLELDQRFAEMFVSNPGSGELVKGHAIVVAELGLCPYRGKVVRDPHLFEGPWAKPRRAQHVIARLAFMQELWSSWGHTSVTLHRGAAVDGPLPPPSSSSFVSATFSAEVATAHFQGGPRTTTAVLWRQSVPISRLLMTFLETPAMSGPYREAEAVLIADPANRAF
jgi:hypothetical protein